MISVFVDHRVLRLIRPIIPVIFVLFFFWMALAMIPLPPQIPGTGLDSSWAYGLSLAHAQNLTFGTDVVFTFGPLGYLYYPVPGLVAAFPAFAVAWAVHALFLFGAFLIWRALGFRLAVLAGWTVLSGAMLLVDAPYERMQISFLAVAVGILALLAARGKAEAGYLAIAGTFAGLFPLFKTNEGVAACAVYYALLASAFLSAPRSPGKLWHRNWSLALVPPAVFLIGFVLIERNLASAPAFAIRSLQVAMGYSEAMALAGPPYQSILGVFSLLALALAVPLLADCRSDLLKGLPPAILAAFFAFKSAMVRQDAAHADLLQVKLAIAGLCLLVCVKNVRDRRLLITYVLATCCLGVSLFQQNNIPQWQFATSRAALLQSPTWAGISGNLLANWHFASTWEQSNGQVQQQLQQLRVDPAVSQLVAGGTVDDVPSELDILPANGWRWKPRPVIQSYSAYTPALDQLNASHLDSRDSADHIIMQWGDIDGRQPLLDDCASWRALFNHYNVVLVRPDLLVLRRRDSPRFLDPSPIGSVVGRWNRDIAVPYAGSGGLNPTGLTMMRAAIHKNLWGDLSGILFRNSPTFLTATYSSGRHAHWRVTRANLADGAFIGYLPAALSETLPYFGQPGTGPTDRVASIRFETPDPAEFSTAIRISWYAVAFRPEEENSAPTSQPPPTTGSPDAPSAPSNAPKALSNILTTGTKGYIDYVNGHPSPKDVINASSRQPITISGWAIDAPAQRAASAVYLDVDGHLFPTSYGSPRQDVATELKDPAYLDSGFSSQISAPPGRHKVSIRIVDSNGTGYYQGPSVILDLK